jgi:hypothetical protein
MQGKGIHFRRCHVCGEVNSRLGEHIERCRHCNKPIAPFYFFDEHQVEVYSENRERPSHENGERSPILGLTAIW